MKPSILVTGASGYLGGTLLANWKAANLEDLYQHVYSLVRKPEQAEAVKQYSVTPVQFDLHDEQAVAENLVSNRISVVVFMTGVTDTKAHTAFIKALHNVNQETGLRTHFIYVGYPAYSFVHTQAYEFVDSFPAPSYTQTWLEDRRTWSSMTMILIYLRNTSRRNLGMTSSTMCVKLTLGKAESGTNELQGRTSRY